MTAREEGFDRRAEPFRAELLAYCYRMLGSAHDAEDLVQDTYLRAWRTREQYDDTRSSLRTWLYRIATNVCLTALAARGRRPLPSGLVAASDPLGPFVQGENLAWLQPLPDSWLDMGDPARAVIDRSSLRLAFAAALQHLSPRQRGALILRDVLSFSASEAAEILGTTAVSVNSSLQRARTRVKQAGAGPEPLSEPSAAEQRAWVDRYMKAFERADVEGLKRLLTEDVLMEMPPMLNWFAGPGNYGLFMEWVFEVCGTDWRLTTVAANGQPGFAAYQRVGDRYEPHTLQIFTVTAGGISRNSVFQGSEVFAAFGLMTAELKSAVPGQPDDGTAQPLYLAAGEQGFPIARFLLIHTLSHMLMRQVALECGYSSASLRERIYLGIPSSPAAGVLISTAASDSEGTLGGLVALGERRYLERILRQALADASHCSSDPLCAEHVPEFPSAVRHNAACHACLFASETSCEAGNRWLDRAVLVDLTGDGFAFPLR